MFFFIAQVDNAKALKVADEEAMHHEAMKDWLPSSVGSSGWAVDGSMGTGIFAVPTFI